MRRALRSVLLRLLHLRKSSQQAIELVHKLNSGTWRKCQSAGDVDLGMLAVFGGFVYFFGDKASVSERDDACGLIKGDASHRVRIHFRDRWVIDDPQLLLFVGHDLAPVPVGRSVES